MSYPTFYFTATQETMRAGRELASHHPLVPSMHSANGYAEKTIHLSSPSASSGFGTLWRWDNGYGVMCGGLDRAFQVLLYAIRYR